MAVSFDPASIISSGVGGVFNYMGAKKQAKATEDAARMQDAATRDALNFTKQQYADVTQRLRPYVEAGSTASAAASRLLQSSPYLAALRPAAAPAGAPPSGAPAGQMVTLRAPDGTTKQFQAGDPIIAKAQAAGAQMVQA